LHWQKGHIGRVDALANKINTIVCQNKADSVSKLNYPSVKERWASVNKVRNPLYVISS